MKKLIEDLRTIDKYKCYGTNNMELCKCLVRDGYNPIKTIIKDGEAVHYFKRTNNFDYDMMFHRGMMEGWLPHMMLELFDIYEEGPGSFDTITE